MIHIVTKNRASLYTPQFEAMPGLLHRIYAANRDNPRIPAGRNEGTDPALTIYLMRIHPSGDLSAAIRLSPSEFRPHSPVQPYDLGFASLPIGPKIWDAGQVCLRAHPDKWMALADMALGTLEFALTWGIKQICFLLDEESCQATRYLPSGVEFAGRPFVFLGETFMPTIISASAASLQSLRELVPDDGPRLLLT